jgi:hypothetical protein
MPQPRKHASAAARQAAYRTRREQGRQVELYAKGLPALPAIATLPGWPRWKASFVAAQALLTSALGEMQDYYDERSEAWQEGDRGEDYQERLALVEAAVDAVGELTL